MSLETEQILLESKINSQRKERTLKSIEADMSILSIRSESSPLLSVEEINIDKIEVAVAALRRCIEEISRIDNEIARLEKIRG
ncbi:MAG: hypothetical protein LBH06_07465 [Rikenellaceae bacterium]|jgi:hypothetical protein|nr:hypothetical protein [Rikenellaceae bacterium]